MPAIEETLSNNFSHFAGGSLCMYGQWFGRPHDNCHKPTGYRYLDHTLTIHFDHGETLYVWAPAELQINNDRLLINKARQVQWEWFYAGRPRIPENRFHTTYNEHNGNVQCTQYNADGTRAFTITSNEPAVHISAL